MVHAGGIVRRALAVPLRFPVPLLVCVAALIRHFTTLPPLGVPPFAIPRADAPLAPGLLAIGACAFMAALSGVLVGERRGWPAFARIVLSAVLGLAAGAVLAFPAVTRPDALLVETALFCLLLLSASGVGGGGRERFWERAAAITGGAGAALLAVIVFIIGASAVEGAIRVLFQLGQVGIAMPIASRYLGPVALAVVGPLVWLASVPPVGAGAPETRMTMRAPLVVARFVAAPLLVLYGLVLIAYAARIAWLGVVPAGQIGSFVPTFGIAGTVVFMVLQRNRGTGDRLVDLYCALWFPLLVVPLALLGAALWMRIEPFGLTLQRGHLLVAAAWLAVVTALFAPRLGRGDLRIIPAVLLVFCLAVAAGPFGLVSLANRDQAGRLTELLTARELVAAGKLVADASSRPLALKDKAQAQSIVRYLGRNHGLIELAPLFAGRADDPFRKAEAPAMADIELRITGFPRDSGRAIAAAEPRHSIGVRLAPSVLAATDTMRVLGPFQIMIGKGQKAIVVDGIEAALDGTVLDVRGPEGRSARFDIAAALEARQGEVSGTPPRIEGPLRMEAPFGSGRITLVLTGTTLSVTRTASNLFGGSYVLVIQPGA